MKILQLSTDDIKGGAARAAFRLHQGLRGAGAHSQMLVRSKQSSDPSVIVEKNILTKLGPPSSGLPLNCFAKDVQGLFFCQWLPDNISSAVKKLNPDIIHLHWVCNGFVQVETLPKLNKPLVWTFHDMWAFTGGCHYTRGCNRYMEKCGKCPQLRSNSQWDLSRWVWQRKTKAWRDLNLTIVTPSQWLAKCASQSPLLEGYRIEVIPNGIDTAVYRPIDKANARELLGLPQGKRLILFSSMDPGDSRKGFSFLERAIRVLSETQLKEDIELVILGACSSERISKLGFKVNFLGRLSDELSLALAYSCADVFVAPSIQENLPNTVMEALACGIPCVAFKLGGLPDMIEHGKSGYLATPRDSYDLSRGISWVLENESRYFYLSNAAREKAVSEYSLERVSNMYLSIFSNTLNKEQLGKS
jgi:glycosyltransferase involved in cell wall biosynthesis